MNSLTDSYLKRLSFSASQAATLAKLGEHRGRQELFTRRIPEVLESLRLVAVVESSDIEADCPGISRDMIRLVLRQLRDSGEITLQGKGRGAKWLRSLP